VTFQNEESVRRCLEDYYGSDSWLSVSGYWFQPPQIRFNGVHRLTVTKAPDPSQVVWQNLELTTTQRLLRQTGVNMLLLGLLAVSFLFIILANAQQQQFRTAVPNLQFCNTVLPALAFNKPVTESFSLFAGDSLPNGLQMLYDPADPTCSAQGRPRVRWTSTDNVAPITSPNNPNLCLNECLAPSGVCTFGAEGKNYTFNPSTFTGCYCYRRLIASISAKGVFTGFSSVVRTDGQVCTAVASQYVIFNLFALVASIIVVVINVFLREILQFITRWEGHPSVAATQRAIATVRRCLVLARWLELCVHNSPHLLLLASCSRFRVFRRRCFCPCS